MDNRKGGPRCSPKSNNDTHQQPKFADWDYRQVYMVLFLSCRGIDANLHQFPVDQYPEIRRKDF